MVELLLVVMLRQAEEARWCDWRPRKNDVGNDIYLFMQLMLEQSSKCETIIVFSTKLSNL